MPENLNLFLIKGSYARPYVQPIQYQDWFSNYITTYVEKDVRQILNIQDAATFQRFIKVCAARVGSILNYSDLARDCEISLNTAKAWISILEASYIIKLLYPYHKNFNKRVIKSPKIYFYDTGLICALLGIKHAENFDTHPMKGHIFESLIIGEFFKHGFNHGQNFSLFFWRDVQDHEIDLIFEKSYNELIPIEIKSRMTFSSDFFKGLKNWANISQQQNTQNYVLYAGQDLWNLKDGKVFPWGKINQMIYEISDFQ